MNWHVALLGSRYPRAYPGFPAGQVGVAGVLPCTDWYRCVLYIQKDLAFNYLPSPHGSQSFLHASHDSYLVNLL